MQFFWRVDRAVVYVLVTVYQRWWITRIIRSLDAP